MYYNRQMLWVYLSPHYDDAVLSCGGMIWEQMQCGDQAEIWTICAGEPTPPPQNGAVLSLSERMQNAHHTVTRRRYEDIAACQRLGVPYRHFPIPDCIYRWLPDGKQLIQSDAEIYQAIHPDEMGLVSEVARMLDENLSPNVQVVSPLTVGGHRDHRMTRQAIEMLGIPVWYFPDFPYVVSALDEFNELRLQMDKTYQVQIGEEGLRAWQEAIQAYASQMIGLFPSLPSMQSIVRAYCLTGMGSGLWQKRTIMGSGM